MEDPSLFNNVTGCIRLGINDWMPHCFVLDQTPPYKVAGSMVPIIQIISNKLGRCMEWTLADELLFGTELPNKSWTGLMGQLMRKEVDVTAVPLTLSESRNRAIDFSVPLYMDSSAILYQRPVLSSDLAGFVKPYTALIWLLSLTSWIAVFFVTFALMQFIHTNLQPVKRVNTMRNSVWLAGLWTYTSILAQSSPWTPQRNSSRIICGVWLLAAFIMNSVYRGNLKAMLILPKLKLPFDNLRELVESKLPAYIPHGSALRELVDGYPPGSLFYQLRDQLAPNEYAPKAARMVAQGKMAGFTSIQVIQFIIHDVYKRTKTCPLYVVSEKFFEATTIGLGFAKGSPLKDRIDPIIQSLNEFGILDHLFRKQVYYADLCSKSESLTKADGTLRPLDIGDFYGVFSLYIGGIIIASIAFFIERVYKRKKLD